MLFHIALFITFVHHEGHLEKAFETEQGYSTSALVGNPNGTKGSDKAYSEKDTCNSRWTPLEGSCLSGEHRSVHCRDGDRLWRQCPLEMSGVQKDGESKSPLLPELWAALEHSGRIHYIHEGDITKERDLAETASLLGRVVGWLL